MRFIRRHLGVWAFAWLSCQVASLSALLPAECCVAHRNLAEKTDCHETTPDAACPMRAADGQACPMHDGANQPDAKEQCAMRAICNGPAMALATLFSIPGVLLTPSTFRVDTQVSLLTPAVERLSGVPASLNIPPPRS